MKWASCYQTDSAKSYSQSMAIPQWTELLFHLVFEKSVLAPLFCWQLPADQADSSQMWLSRNKYPSAYFSGGWWPRTLTSKYHYVQGVSAFFASSSVPSSSDSSPFSAGPICPSENLVSSIENDSMAIYEQMRLLMQLSTIKLELFDLPTRCPRDELFYSFP